jgi:Fe-S-cluster-containing hydrogenase component 2
MKRWEREGVVELEDLDIPSEEYLRKGVAITECLQEIPCNPCVEACPVDAISMETINDTPKIDYEKCIGCGNCVDACPGLAMFLVKVTGDSALITLPYEFLPVPEKEERVKALNREGKKICDAVVKRIRRGRTTLVTIEVPAEYALEARNIKVVR